MHPDLTIAVARDRHLRRTAAVEKRSDRLVSRDTVWRPPAVVPVPVAPVRLRVIPGGLSSGTRTRRSRPAA